MVFYFFWVVWSFLFYLFLVEKIQSLYWSLLCYYSFFFFILISSGDKLYVGTTDGHVLLYVIEKQKNPDGKTSFVSNIS